MKFLGKKFIYQIISMFAMYLFIIIFCIIFSNVWLAIISYIVLSIIGLYIFYRMIDWYPEKMKQLSNDKFHELKDKLNPSLFEKLYVNAYNDFAVEILENILDLNNINNVNSLDFDAVHNKKYITFTFNSKRHSVYYHIYENKVEYYIDSPKKYDHLAINEEYEKVQTIDIMINDFNSLESFFEKLIPYIKENLLTIEEFEENVNLLNINQKTLEEIQDYNDFNKEMGIFLNVLSIILVIIMIVLTVVGMSEIKNEIKENVYSGIALFLVLVLLDGFVLFSYFISVFEIIKSKKIKKDIENQLVEKIVDKPYKVKIMVTSVGYKHNVTRFACGIKLFFKGEKKTKLIFAHYFEEPNKKQKKKIKDELMKKELELQYYNRSKLIVSGLEQYRKKIKNILRNKE